MAHLSAAHHPRLRDKARAETRKEIRKELADREESCDVLIFGQGMVADCINSWQLWLPAEDLDKVKPIRILARMMAETERPRSYQRSYRQVMAAEGRRITPLGMWLGLCCSCLKSQSHSHLYVSSTK